MMNHAEAQRPVRGPRATTPNDRYAVITHPAFRLGFLDAQSRRPFDHDRIVDRILAETPPGSLKRTGYARRLDRERDLLGCRSTIPETEVAQYRYEEGRLAVFAKGFSCKAWGHPDFPPAVLQRFIMEYAGERTT